MRKYLWRNILQWIWEMFRLHVKTCTETYESCWNKDNLFICIIKLEDVFERIQEYFLRWFHWSIPKLKNGLRQHLNIMIWACDVRQTFAAHGESFIMSRSWHCERQKQKICCYVSSSLAVFADVGLILSQMKVHRTSILDLSDGTNIGVPASIRPNQMEQIDI